MFVDIKVESKTGATIDFGKVEKFIVISEEFEILDYKVADVDCEESVESSLIISIDNLPALTIINNAKKYYIEIEEQLKEVIFKGHN